MNDPVEQLSGSRVLITGVSGSLGTALSPRLAESGCYVVPTDIASMDVRDFDRVNETITAIRPDVIFHLAGAKHAPDGEIHPFGVAETNITGTENVLCMAESIGAKVVLASTCKACNPETAYGATKLIAERMVLNADGGVARFYNVPETCGNVFELWRNLPDDEPIPVTPCTRYFNTIEQAIDLLLWAAVLNTGRYCIDPGEPVRMQTLASRLYPSRPQRHIPPRRGDRLREPRYATNETSLPLGFSGVESVWSPHDPVRELVAA